MLQAKWLKSGAAALLSLSILAACGGEAEDEDVVPADEMHDEHESEEDEEESGE